jgi:hypothetical protein
VVDVAARRSSLAECLHRGRAVLVTRVTHAGLADVVVPLRDRLEVATIPDGPAPPRWLDGVNAALVRPDGHIAWLASSDADVESLFASAEHWLGAAPRGAKPPGQTSRIG